MRPRLTIALLCLLPGLARADGLEVGNDQTLADALARARPGDAIRLAPGDYRGGLHVTVRGEKDKPVTIESANREKPARILGALHLSGARHVIVRDLIITGSKTNGLNIDDGGDMTQSAVGIVVERVTVTDTGPTGNTDGIKLSGLKDFVVRECTVEGWGGSAIDMVGCADGVIERSVFKGKAGFDQSSGIQMKGGTQRVTVHHNRFENAGARAINAGGSTGLKYFRPPDAKFEAKDLLIEHNQFKGSEAPVAFVGIDGAVFRNNTIVEPGKWVLRILQETTEAGFAPCRNVTFERNIIVYNRASVRDVVNIGPNTDAKSFKYIENWWWCADAKTMRPVLKSNERLGVYGRDPKLKEDENGWLLPGDPNAEGFGVKAPQTE